MRTNSWVVVVLAASMGSGGVAAQEVFTLEAAIRMALEQTGVGPAQWTVMD